MSGAVLVFTGIAMLFFHIVDDFCLQLKGLSNFKQKLWWKNEIDKVVSTTMDEEKRYEMYSKYKYDYIVGLVMHAAEWSFAILIPLFILFGVYQFAMFYVVAFFVNAVVHGVVDDLKANRFKLNLVEDQLIHLAQIVLTVVLFATLCLA